MALAQRPVLLVLRALGLGDLLTAVPALRALALAFPDHHRVLATPATLTPLVELAGAIHEVVDARPLAPLPEALAGVDVAVNLHGSGPQSHEVLLALEPRRLVAHRAPGAWGDGPAWDDRLHEVDRWCRLLEWHGMRADRSDLDLALPRHHRLLNPAPVGAAGATVVHPGAASPARRWPAERWAAVARAEVGARPSVVVTGGPDEVDLGEAVASAAALPASAVLAGRTDVATLATVVAGAGRVVCGDTGVAHLATALGVPSVVLFGPTPPSLWGPPPERSDRHRVLWAGRRGDPHATTGDPGLLAITVDDVLAELRSLDRSEVDRPERSPTARPGTPTSPVATGRRARQGGRGRAPSRTRS